MKQYDLTDATVFLWSAQEALRRGYQLSFACINTFEPVYCVIRHNDRVGIGESTPLPGYSDETREDIEGWCGDFLEPFRGCPFAALEKEIAGMNAGGFREAPVLLACESLQEFQPVLDQADVRVPVIAVAQETEDSRLKEEIIQLSQDFRTIKMKIGMNLTEDIRRVKAAQLVLKDGTRLRLDANQGYTYEDADEFLVSIDASSVEWVEQPLRKDHWAEMRELRRQYGMFNFLLDESIGSMEDIDTALSFDSCDGVKLKLFKCGTVSRMAACARYAHEKGLGVVIGNGVQDVVGTLWEAIGFHLLVNEGVPLGDTELIGPLKLKNDRGRMIEQQGASLTVYPRRITEWLAQTVEGKI